MLTRRTARLALLVGVVGLAGCGGPTGGPGSVQIAVSPASVTLARGATQSFTATVSGAADDSVTWSATCGAIGSGNPSTYTAPMVPGSCTVRAASVERATASATAVVTVTAGTAAPGAAWTRQFGTRENDRANGVAFDSSGSIYVVGFTSDDLAGDNAGSWTPDAFVRKYTSTGEVSWTRQFGTSSRDYANDVAVTTSGSIVVVGETNGAMDGPAMGGSDAFVRALDPDGNVLWARQFGGGGSESAEAVATDATGIFVAGDTFLRKYSHAGAALWTQPFGGITSEGASIAVDASGDVVLVTNDHLGAIITKFAGGDGGVVWSRAFRIGAEALARDVAIGPTGTVFVVGEAADAVPSYPDFNFSDGFVRTYDTDGNEIWTHLFEDLGSSDEVAAVAIDSSGAAVAFGREAGGLFLRAIDASSSVLWTLRFGTDESDYAEDMAFSASMGIVVAGGTKGNLASVSAGYEDAFVRLYRP